MTRIDSSPLPASVDVLVVGAGPAGTLAAYGIAREGASVLLVDRSPFPRSKVCGCCVNARALELLATHGLRDRVEAMHPHRYGTLQVTAGGVRATVAIPEGISIARDKFDGAMAQAATAAGAIFRDRTVASSIERPRRGTPSPQHRITLTTDGHASSLVTCRVLIAADGLGGAVTRAVAGSERIAHASRIGAGAVVDDPPFTCDDGCINMVVGRHGYVGIVRLEDGRWNLAAALDPSAVKHVRDVGIVVNGVLTDAGCPASEVITRATWRGTVSLSRRPSRVADTAAFVVGDAAGYVEPFTGDGIAAALESGALAVPFALRAIHGWNDHLASEWTQVLTRHRARQRRLTTIAAWTLRRPALARHVLRVLARVPSLATPVIDSMHQSIIFDRGAVT